MRRLRICLVSSEVTPFSKTGGLADVTAALARHLGSKGHEVRVFSPMYRRVREGGWSFQPHRVLQDVALEFGDTSHAFSVSTCRLPDSRVEVHFVRCPALYDRDGIYTSDADEHLRFALLSRAAVESCQWLRWAPDVFHCNDWHTALIPLYLRTIYAWDAFLSDARTVLTLHNIGYQGVFSSDTLHELRLEDRRSLLYQEDLAEGRINFLKTGILYADALTTVSRTYAREIQTAEHGMGLEGLLAARDDHLFGIVNGVDYGEWSPEKDARIPARYSADDLAGKATCKRALLERLGLDAAEPAADGPGAPVLGIVSRLTAQKGFELLPDILPIFLQREDLRLAVLGGGEQKYEQYFAWLERTFPGKVAFRSGYDEELAHWIEAGADLFLMPSRYEPCGLNQMYSLRYGTLPVVRRTGGLADTVEPYDPGDGSGTGFVFDDFTSEALQQAIAAALAVWRDPPAWRRLMRAGMARDYSWARQGALYEELYEQLLPAAGAETAPGAGG